MGLVLVLTGCATNNSAGELDDFSLPQEEKKVIVETAEIKQGNLYSERGISAQVVFNARSRSIRKYWR